MKALSVKKKNPHRLMHMMTAISLAVHLLMFIHIPGLIRSETISYIELSLQDIPKPFNKSIPEPVIKAGKPKNKVIKKTVIQKKTIPVKKNISLKMKSPDLPVEKKRKPDVPENEKHKVSDLKLTKSHDPTVSNSNKQSVSPADYFDMLRHKIEQNKKYPKRAKRRHIEGRVKIQFVVTNEGLIKFLKIVKRAKDRDLNKAALNAVRNAAPFPRPPSDLLEDALHMEITLVFELT